MGKRDRDGGGGGGGASGLTRKQKEKAKENRKKQRRDKLDVLLETVDLNKVRDEIAQLERASFLAPNQKERLRDLRRISDESDRREKKMSAAEAEAAEAEAKHQEELKTQGFGGSAVVPGEGRKRYELDGGSSSDDDSSSDEESDDDAFMGLLHNDVSIQRSTKNNAPQGNDHDAAAGSWGAVMQQQAPQADAGGVKFQQQRSVLDNIDGGSGGGGSAKPSSGQQGVVKKDGPVAATNFVPRQARHKGGAVATAAAKTTNAATNNTTKTSGSATGASKPTGGVVDTSIVAPAQLLQHSMDAEALDDFLDDL